MRVGLIAVGDEILAGDTVNTNAAWLAEELTDRGVTVERSITIRDRIEEISAVVERFAERYDATLLTGGLGPTHDDLTMAGVAAAFDRELEVNENAIAWLEERRGYAREDLAEGTASLPVGARALDNEVGVAPGCVIDSVYVFPGVPEEMHAMFESVKEEFTGTPIHVENVLVNEPESALLDRLETVRERFSVTIGSYPGESVRIKLQDTDEAEVAAAADWLREHVELAEE